MTLQEDIIGDLKGMEYELGQPTFQWNSSTYNFIPSITEFRRDLEVGGFQIDKLLTATVRKFDFEEDELIPLFPNGIPTSQQKIVYSIDGLTYRIDSIKIDPTNSYFRMIAHCDTKMF